MRIPQRRVVALFATAAIAATACGQGTGATTGPTTAGQTTGPTGAALSGTVAIDGSSTVFPITELVAEEFQLANPGVRVPVAFTGTGGGFKKFCTGETDINDASRPIKAEDEGEGLACEANGIEYVELQIAIDGLTVVVNPGERLRDLPDGRGARRPSTARTRRRTSCGATSAPASRPSEVERYMPGADSGTFDYFTEVINGEVDAATTHATQSEDDNELVTGVAGDVNAIGFFGYAYFVENQDKLKARRGRRRRAAASRRPSETINDNSYSPLSRPLFIYPNVGKAQRAPGAQGLRRLLPRQHQRVLRRGRLHRPPGRPARSGSRGMGGRRRRLTTTARSSSGRAGPLAGPARPLHSDAGRTRRSNDSRHAPP